LYDYYPNGVGRADFIKVGLYVDPAKANGKTEGLKPYFYVLNNLLCATIDPKVGDDTSVPNHTPTILVCFGLEKRFSVTDLLWHHIQEVSLTSNQSFPYALYLMYVIEQVTGFGFHHDMKWEASTAKSSKGKGLEIEASGSGAAQDDEGAVVVDDKEDAPPMDPSIGASGGCGCGHGCGRGRGSPTRHVLQRFMSYFYYY
jgi:hypothetical protein